MNCEHLVSIIRLENFLTWFTAFDNTNVYFFLVSGSFRAQYD